MPHRLNIGDQSWRKSEEVLGIEEELRHVTQGPAPLNGGIAFNEGTRDGYTGKPRRALLQSEFRQHYILGYRSGSWPRFTSREIRKQRTNEYIWWFSDEEYRAISDEVFDLMFMPRYPHDPPVWYA